MPKRVFILAPHDPEMPGGVEHFVRELRKGLCGRGYEVQVLCRENCLPPWLLSRNGRIGRSLADAALSWYMGRELRARWSGDVAAVISNSTVGWYVPGRQASSTKLVHMYHGTYRAQADAMRPYITRCGYWKQVWWDSMVLERFAGRGKLVLCCSDQAREEVSHYFGYRGTTIWNPLDTAHFRLMDRLACRRNLGVPEKTAIGLFVGNCHPMKGFSTVRALIEALDEVHWLLAIRGDVPENYHALPRVRLFQNAPHSQMPQIYGAADFSVAPSLYEAFPYAVTEPLACGTPVIASPNGASRLFLREPPLDRLLVSHADDVEGFAAAAREVIRTPEVYRRAIAERIRPRLVETISPERWWARFCEVTGL